MTIRDLLNEGILFLVDCGGTEKLSDTALSALNAELLLAYSLDESREFLFANANGDADPGSVYMFWHYIKRLASGEPIAYIIKKKEFYGLDFFVDQRVLIPRPETEMLVEAALKFSAANPSKKLRILDLGTGSGNIAISLAKNLPDECIDLIDAVDLSEAACEVAKINALQHGVDDRVSVFPADLLDFADENGRYDLIVANLPYIGEVSHDFVSENVEKYEPNSALFAGDDGLALYKNLFEQILGKNITCDLLIF
ncbi:peptide chain release factor N(5)-glutamine methyltransferase [Candidatus Peregrinibacteria bacterium]|nr:peptide chain release factor N(5)-glutamine methyltransferase [Candidatus Peregrinibacteria bacterium]